MSLHGIMNILTDRRYRFCSLAEHGLLNWMPDDIYLKRKYRIIMEKDLDLNNPITFNEKLQWLKIHNRKPIYSQLVDKYEVKQYVAGLIGEEYVIPTYGVWNHFDEIDFDRLPMQFVLKTTHDSGGVVICRNKHDFDYENAKKKLEFRLKQNFYWHGREWPYKNVKPRIIAEKLICDSNNTDSVTDYKFLCFDGYVDNVMVCIDRNSASAKYYFFNQEWVLQRINVRGKNAPENFSLPKPSSMDKMFEIASQLSLGFPALRVDLYNCNDQIYFGELTFYPSGGYDKNLLPETDCYFGRLIDLSKVK